MKNIRRSLNKDKALGSPPTGYRSPDATSPPLPQNAAAFQPIARSQANEPPQMVIRATESYRARRPVELSFEKGDFFHVVGERPEEGLFDASNPATGARGLVPISCFQVLGRSERDKQPPGGHHADVKPFGVQPVPSTSMAQMPMPSKRVSGNASQKGQTLYGVVQYDFAAERGDELDAKRGDNIIIIAQSNHEWFVAKPIGRLGGPGLIPVSFVEIQNMATGKALDPQIVQDMIKGGALPGVEEWKKSTAEYKQSSIPLGRFDFPGAPQQQHSMQPSNSTGVQPPPANGVQRGAARASTGGRQAASHHESTSSSRLAPSYPPTHDFQSAPTHSERSSYPAESVRFSSSNKSTSASHEATPEEQADRYGTVSGARVVLFHWEEGSYWFHLEVQWDSGAELVLYRLYDDFYDYHEALKEGFPVEAGKEVPAGAPASAPLKRILPWLPGKAPLVDEFVSTQRVTDLSTYLAELMLLPKYLLQNRLTNDFFCLRPGDVETRPPRAQMRTSNPVRADQAEGELVEQLRKMPGAASSSASSRAASTEPHQRISTDMAGLSINGKISQDRGSGALRVNTPSPAPPGNHAAPIGSSTSGGPAPSFLKIKIFQRATDDLIAIRVPPDVSLAQLIGKASERLGTDVRSLSWREDVPGLGGAHLRALANDYTLDQWLNSGARLVLYAD